MMRFGDMFRTFRARKRVLAVSDAFIVAVAALIANFPLPLFADRIGRPDLFVTIVLSVGCCFGSLMFFGAYNKLWRYFNRADYFGCIKGVALGILVSNVFTFVASGDAPWEFSILHAIVAMTGICLFRYMFKDAFDTLVETGHKEARSGTRVMIIGAGSACRILLREIKQKRVESENGESSSKDLLPVCLIDDDRRKIGKLFNGVYVVGGSSEIPKIAKHEKIDLIIFAIPSCPARDRQVILGLCSKTGLPVKLLPFIGSLLDSSTLGDGSTNFIGQIRDIKVEDLLGRDPVKFDNKNIRDFIEGKVCMVTGGGGSIGSELVRQIAKYGPSRIVIVDNYENNAYEIQQELLMEYGDTLRFDTIIASVRDYFRMNQVFKKFSPDVVFHAAAHKHVPLMEHNPTEAIKNNVMGTFNIAFLSLFHKVHKFVMISTDKAVNPTNVMGASKRCCEMIVQYLAQQKKSDTEFVCTRFGNVLGSNGSVIPLFKRQIEQGKPVTVTHPDIIRYFMTIPEAVSLVMEAASIAHGGEIFVLDMGQPVKIVTLAENLIRMYGKVPYKDVEIKFTGLRPGEKIKEELLMDEEGLEKTQNELIFIGKQLQIDGEHFIGLLGKLRDAASGNDETLTIAALREIVPTFTTPEEFNRVNLAKSC